jgi:hypothetical protein
MNTNKIGLEAEFLLTDANNNLVYPQDHGFGCDDFCILGEFRGEPGATREETIANFYKAYYTVIFQAKQKKLNVEIKDGWRKIDPTLYAAILRKMGSKSVAQCKNIYNMDILSLSDAEIEGGKVTSQKVSAGLHIHFSSEDVSRQSFTADTYESVKLPINLNHAEACFELYRKTSQSTKTEIVARANRISSPVIKYIVESLDKGILPEFTKTLPNLKYRNPGFYESKAYGIEYRSLPFNKNVLEKIDSIVDYSYDLLENL